MKDNEKNLSNEAAEAVAGGDENDWLFPQKRQFEIFSKKLGYDDKSIKDIIDHYTPDEVLEMVEENRKHFTAEQLREVRKILENPWINFNRKT